MCAPGPLSQHPLAAMLPPASAHAQTAFPKHLSCSMQTSYGRASLLTRSSHSIYDYSLQPSRCGEAWAQGM